MPRAQLPPPRLSPDSLDPIHPGDVLLEEFLRPLGMSLYALAQALHIPLTRISQVVHAQRSVTADTATRLAVYFGTTVDLWLNLQARHEAEVARRVLLDQIRSEIQPRAA